MMRFVAVVLVVAGVAVAARAEPFTHPRAQFRVTIPDGWTKSVDPEEDVALLAVSPRAKETIGFCFVQSSALPGTETTTQEELDKNLSGEFDKAFWEQSLKEGDMKDVAIETAGEKKQGGLNAYYAVATFTDDDGDRVKLKTMSMFIPGRAYNIWCMALAAGYPQEEADFDAFLDSFAPQPADLVVSRMPAQPTAKLSNVTKEALSAEARREESAKGLGARKAWLTHKATGKKSK